MADVPKDLTGVLQDISGGEFHAVATARLAALAATMQSYPYSYYYGGYHTYVIHGGTVSRPSSGVYSRSYSGPRSSFSGGSGTVRGMGGSIGAARSSGGFGS